MENRVVLFFNEVRKEVCNFIKKVCNFIKKQFDGLEAHLYAFITVLVSLLIISIIGACIITPEAAESVLALTFEKLIKYIFIAFDRIIELLNLIPLLGYFIPDINIGTVVSSSGGSGVDELAGISVDVQKIRVQFPAAAIKIFVFTLVVGGLVGVFPITFLAYNYSRKPFKVRRFMEELKLFGLITEEQPDRTELEEQYNTFYSPPQFLTFIFLLIGLSTIAFALFYVARSSQNNDLLRLLPSAQIEILFYTFLGAYFFGVQYVVRRYSTIDLQPQVFASIVLRILLSGTIIFGITALLDLPKSTSPPQTAAITSPSSLPAADPLFPSPTVEQPVEQPVEQTIDRQAQSLDARSFNLLSWQILAFVIGAFPNQGFRWIMLAASRAFRDPTASQLNERPLRKIFGINAWHEARLEEVGIDDIQNLATADIRKLLLTTQFDTMEIANWIDQAILHMKAGLKVEQYNAFQITTYHELRTVLLRIKDATIETDAADSADSKQPEPFLQNGNSQNGHQVENQNGQSEEFQGRLLTEFKEFKERIAVLSRQMTQTTQMSLHREEYNKLATALGYLSIAELERLCDFSNYPNYIHIEEYYRNIENVTRRRAEKGTEEVISGTGSGGKVINIGQSTLGFRFSNDSDEQNLRRKQAFQKAEELEKRLLTGNPTLTELNEVGTLWYNVDNLYNAKKAYDRAIAKASPRRQFSEVRRLLSGTYTNRSLVYIKLGNQAKEDFARTVQAHLQRVEADVLSPQLDERRRAAEEKAQRLYEKAISDNHEAIELDPSNANAFNNLAIAYIRQKDFPMALEKLQRALSLDDRLGHAYYNRGTIRNTLAKNSQDFEQAAYDFERAYLLGFEEIALWATWGLALLNQGKFEEAIEKYSKAIALDPGNSAESYGNRGYAYMELGRKAQERQQQE